jgi:hypothetical protein
VPVLIHDLDDDDPQVTLLRVDENMRRRTLKPSEMARAVDAWYGATAIHQGDRTDLTSAPGAEVPALIGRNGQAMSERSREIYRHLANLIKPLADMLDSGDLAQKVACQLAQQLAHRRRDAPETRQDGSGATFGGQDE